MHQLVVTGWTPVGLDVAVAGVQALVGQTVFAGEQSQQPNALKKLFFGLVQ